MVEFAAPPGAAPVAPVAPLSQGQIPTPMASMTPFQPPIEDDSMTVRRDRADLVEMIRKAEAERASTKLKAAEAAEPPATTKRGADEIPELAKGDMAKTIATPFVGAEPAKPARMP